MKPLKQKTRVTSYHSLLIYNILPLDFALGKLKKKKKKTASKKVTLGKWALYLHQLMQHSFWLFNQAKDSRESIFNVSAL